jgi:hypothetical protein
MYTVNLQFPLASSADISATLRRVVFVLATYRWLLGHWGVLRVAYLNIITGNDLSSRLLLQGGRRSPANRCRHVPPHTRRIDSGWRTCLVEFHHASGMPVIARVCLHIVTWISDCEPCRGQ